MLITVTCWNGKLNLLASFPHFSTKEQLSCMYVLTTYGWNYYYACTCNTNVFI